MSTVLPGEVRSALDKELTYSEVGASITGDLPDGYRHNEQCVRVGKGRDTFDLATEALMSWQVQRGAGLTVLASSEHVAPDEVAIVRLSVGPINIDGANRVTEIVDEPTRQGFAYGTLDGHPERGEQAFLVEIDDSDTVTFTVRSFSKPSSLIATIGGPLNARIQDQIAERYLMALLEAAHQSR
ncbi:MAG TPA: DUF1990 domain-containing protein [Intrasporangiaceae bacterium]|nr:DUF1990 domain-containing protein [Intrasporangiaceae bacterium]